MMNLRVRAALLLCAACLLLLLLWRNEQASALENTFFYADDNGDSDLLATEAGDAFSEVSQQKQEQPAPVVQSVCTLAEFAPRARRLNMTIFFFAWRRLASVQRLLDSLQAAEYCGHQIPLTIFVDGGASEAVVSAARAAAWTHGKKALVLYDELGLTQGIRGMWINASGLDAPDHTHVLPLEDDVEVSPLYYWWLLRAARFYDPPAGGAPAGGEGLIVEEERAVVDDGRRLYFSDGERLLRRDRLVGISLYTPRLNEIAYPQVKWSPDLATQQPAFLLQVPCSWGALYFGSVWKDFLRFYMQRVRPPFFDLAQEAAQRGIGKDLEPLGEPCLQLPSSRSNVWPRSWKRFMLDYMYGRGMTMLYPNLARQRSFSTTHMERGGHSGKDGSTEAVSAHGLHQDVDPLKTVPLLAALEISEVHRRLERLPPLESLPAFDLHHSRRSRATLVLRGFAFTEGIRAWGVRYAARLGNTPELAEQRRALIADYNALAATWSGVSDVDTGGAATAAHEALAAAVGAGAAGSSEPARGCALEQLWHGTGGTGAAAPGQRAEAAAVEAEAGGGARKYLVYQPPGGLGEWFVALRNAAAVARSLGRTLVLPHLMWDGGTATPVRFSRVFSLAPLRALLPEIVEMADFVKLRLAPRRLVLLRVKEPHLLPSRTYFDQVVGWANVSAVHMPAQSCAAKDYARLYAGCSDRVLAFSSLYAAFDGFGEDARAQAWLEATLTPALLHDLPAVSAKAARIVNRLRRDRPTFSCVHLSDLDTAVINARAPLPPDATEGVELSIDVAEPAARHRSRPSQRACEAYDQEAERPLGRRWVKDQMSEGMACQLNDALVSTNLGQLPPRDTIFALSDGERTFPPLLAERAASLLRAEVMHVGDLVSLERLEVSYLEWPAIELQVCSQADSLLLNRYSPISYLLKWRAEHRPTPTAAAQAPLGAGQEAPLSPPRSPTILWWTRLDSDACLPLFTRTARFDIQPNRFGILGQFGPERKLQLSSTNITSLIGWNGKLMANASVELEVYVSNASHTLHIFEYTKDNNQKGIQFAVKPPPGGGWRTHEWHAISVPITDTEYSFPMSTPWENMDRLELYYANPAANQPRGDYIRIRNVFLRSSRSYSQRKLGLQHKCSELVGAFPPSPPATRSPHEAAPGAGQASQAEGSLVGSTGPAHGAAGRTHGGDDFDDGALMAESAAFFRTRSGATQLRRRLLLGLGVPLLITLLAFSFAPRHATQVAAAVCAGCADVRRRGGHSPEEAIGGSRLGTWLSIVRRKPTRSFEDLEQTTWSAGHGARDAHHRNVVG